MAMAMSKTNMSTRPRCDECNRFMSRPSDTCGACGREHAFVPAAGYSGGLGYGATEADRIAYDMDAGWVPPASEDWDRELARLDRQQREYEESHEPETVLYDGGMSDRPSSVTAAQRMRALEAQLAEARAAYNEALRTDRQNGWSTARLAAELGVTRQAIGQQTKGVKPLPAGRKKSADQG